MSTAVPVTDADHPRLTERVTILVPVHYPVTAQSTKTLTRATALADHYTDVHIVVLHVNLVHYPTRVTRQELYQTITPIVDGHTVDVSIRRGVILEECILDEAQLRGADIIVVGHNQKAAWRRYLSRLLGNDPDLPSFLRTHTDADLEVVG